MDYGRLTVTSHTKALAAEKMRGLAASASGAVDEDFSLPHLRLLRIWRTAFWPHVGHVVYGRFAADAYLIATRKPPSNRLRAVVGSAAGFNPVLNAPATCSACARVSGPSAG